MKLITTIEPSKRLNFVPSTLHPSSQTKSATMPSEVSDIKQFIEICRRKDASSARIKRNRKTSQTKFKVRCHRFLYTLVLKDSDKADKLKQSLPPALKIEDVSKGGKKKTI
ncbi:large subunit ribosomal protein L38e [Talaromyces islandicus]|uniref:Large subunit ribosomal protein L38e n=1 Tax=Talaromyces islandicus TaxID=28573 RepID=A0A0U1LXA2_TALIS|nr:large subunit ribosomal protein L38e [Talaromyces islandicus]